MSISDGYRHMKFVRYDSPAGPAFGALKESGAIYAIDGDIFTDYTVGAQIGTTDDTCLIAPLQPGKVIAVGANYLAHILENHGPEAIPKFPMLFMKPTTAVIGPGQAIKLPDPSRFTQAINDTDLQNDPFGEVHFEAELVAVVGKTCRNISEADALDYLLGFSCGNDVSARDLQMKEMATGVLLMSKGMDTFAPLGPCIATDLDPENLSIGARLNGKQVQNSSTSDLLFSVASLVAYISQGVTLEPGDCIYTGTPAGPSALSSGDSIEIEVEGIGILRNPVENDASAADS